MHFSAVLADLSHPNSWWCSRSATLQGGGMDACIALSINLMIVHLYKPQQVYSTSVSLLVEQCKQTKPKKTGSETPS